MFRELRAVGTYHNTDLLKMKTSFLAILISGLVLVGAGWFAMHLARRDVQQTEINATRNQLRNVLADIEQGFFDRRNQAKPTTLKEVIQSLVEEKGVRYLQSEVRPNQALLVNPSAAQWTNESLYSNELAVVAPVTFKDRRSGSSYSIGMTFSGRSTNLSELPNW